MAQVGYICLGTNNFDRACGFWDGLAPELGGKKLFPTPQGVMYRLGAGPMIMVTRPYDKQDHKVGNGHMLAINVDAQEDVSRVYEKALSLGATSEGEPGPRGAFGEFAYFRDLDGNKIAVFFSERQKKN
jgi:catechol 2,3-dioxygenase-like lactoylglutathione lyase family enzyme